MPTNIADYIPGKNCIGLPEQVYPVIVDVVYFIKRLKEYIRWDIEQL